MATQNIKITRRQELFTKSDLSVSENLEGIDALKIKRLRLEAKKGADAYERGEYIELGSADDVDNLFDGIRKEVKTKRKAK